MTDGAAIWRLVCQTDVLDTNSCYAYLLLCTDFADTCLVSYDGERLAGFVTGYRPPGRPDVLFVWQIGVDPAYRGRGLGRALLGRLVERAAAQGVRYLEATVTPDNDASRRLFRWLADARRCELATTSRFEPPHFAAAEHEPEQLIRIGPLQEKK